MLVDIDPRQFQNTKRFYPLFVGQFAQFSGLLTASEFEYIDQCYELET